MNKANLINKTLILLGLQDERYIDSQAARVAVISDFNTWYDTARQCLLREFNWHFCIDTQPVTRLVDNLTPGESRLLNSVFRYLYRLPSASLGLADANSSYGYGNYEDSLDGYAGGGSVNGMMKFRPLGGQKYLVTQSVVSNADIIGDVTDISQWSPEFTMLLAYDMATHLAPTVRSSREVRHLGNAKKLINDRAKYVASHDVINREMG